MTQPIFPNDCAQFSAVCFIPIPTSRSRSSPLLQSRSLSFAFTSKNSHPQHPSKGLFKASHLITHSSNNPIFKTFESWSAKSETEVNNETFGSVGATGEGGEEGLGEDNRSWHSISWLGKRLDWEIKGLGIGFVVKNGSLNCGKFYLRNGTTRGTRVSFCI